MTTMRLLQHFHRIAEAPGAIPHLRRFILELAVRGHLVESGRATPARHTNELLAAYPVGPDVGEAASDIAFRLPFGWTASTLGEVAECLDGARRPVNAAERARRIEGKEASELYPYFGATQQQGWIDGYLFDEELVLLGEDGVAFLDPLREKAYIIRGRTWVNNHAHVFRPISIDAQFLCHWLNIFDYSGRVVGATRAKLNQSKALKIPIPLPPRTEQQRIVAKVTDLMSLCDQLEATQAEREARRTKSITVSLRTLNSARTAQRKVEDIHGVLERIASSTEPTKHIQELRDSIRTLAVTGGFSSPGARPAAPASLRDFGCLQNGYAFKSEWFVPSGIRLVRNANVSHGTLRWNDRASIAAERAKEFEPFLLCEGDIVLSLDRPFIATGTKVARVRKCDLPSLLLQRVGRFQVDTGRLLPSYLLTWLQSPAFSSQITPGRSNGVPHVSSKEVEAALIWVPSLHEQERIMNELSRILVMCDELEAQLTRSKTTQRRLLDALIDEAVLREPRIDTAAQGF